MPLTQDDVIGIITRVDFNDINTSCTPTAPHLL